MDPGRDDHDGPGRHVTTPKLLKLIAGGRLDPTVFATHRFSLGETMEAYDVFAAAAETNALKVVLEGSKHQQLISSSRSARGNGARAKERGDEMSATANENGHVNGAGAGFDFSRVLVGVDGSDESIEAARQAALLAEGPITLSPATKRSPGSSARREGACPTTSTRNSSVRTRWRC